MNLKEFSKWQEIGPIEKAYNKMSFSQECRTLKCLQGVGNLAFFFSKYIQNSRLRGFSNIPFASL